MPTRQYWGKQKQKDLCEGTKLPMPAVSTPVVPVYCQGSGLASDSLLTTGGK